MHDIKLNIVIISYNCIGHTINCIKSIKAGCHNTDYVITIVDNASTDGTVAKIKSDFPEVNLIENKVNAGYAGAVNIGAESVRSEFLLISNADVIYPEDSIAKLLKYIEKHPDIGAAGPQQIYPDGSWQASYGDYPGVALGFKDLLFFKQIKGLFLKIFWKYLPLERSAREVPFLDGACILTKKEYFDSIKGFDTDFFFYTEETDFCKRLSNQGLRIVFYPKARIVHFRGGSSGYSLSENSARLLTESKIKFCRKHYPDFHTRTFIRLEYWHFSILYMISVIIPFIGKGPGDSRMNNVKIKRLIRDILRQNL